MSPAINRQLPATSPAINQQSSATLPVINILFLIPSRPLCRGVVCCYTSLPIYVTHRNTHGDAYRSARPVCLPLFFECENTQIEEIREQLKSQVKKAVKHYLPDSKISTKFIGTQYNNNPKWDNYLASLGLIPNTTVKEIQELLEDEQKHTLKTIIADIAKNIMNTNIDIWKHRCKILYGNWQAIT